MLIVLSIYRPFKNEIYVIIIADINNDINKTLKFTYVGSVEPMIINKFSQFPIYGCFC